MSKMLTITDGLHSILLQLTEDKQLSSIEVLIWELLKDEIELSEVIRCDDYGCHNPAIYEGWMRVHDPLTGNPSGLIRKMRVCEEHKHGLIGV